MELNKMQDVILKKKKLKKKKKYHMVILHQLPGFNNE